MNLDPKAKDWINHFGRRKFRRQPIVFKLSSHVNFSISVCLWQCVCYTRPGCWTKNSKVLGPTDWRSLREWIHAHMRPQTHTHKQTNVHMHIITCTKTIPCGSRENGTSETTWRFIKWHGFGLMQAESPSLAVDEDWRVYIHARGCVRLYLCIIWEWF